jgi:hypothetical protein
VGGHRYEGYCIDLVRMVAQRANFEYTIYVQNDYGRLTQNGTWDGMVGELVRKVRF